MIQSMGEMLVEEFVQPIQMKELLESFLKESKDLS
jgi:hypothetical protein